MHTIQSIILSCEDILKQCITAFNNSHHTEVCPTLLFIPQIIDNSIQAKKYINNKKTQQTILATKEKKMNLDELAKIIYESRNMVSWIDFYLYSSESNYTLFIVELICLNKSSENICYHASFQ